MFFKNVGVGRANDLRTRIKYLILSKQERPQSGVKEER